MFVAKFSLVSFTYSMIYLAHLLYHRCNGAASLFKVYISTKYVAKIMNEK